MSNFILYFRDLAPEGTKLFTNWTNGSNATNGYGSSLGEITDVIARIEWEFASSVKIGAVGLFNHDFDSGGTPGVKVEYDGVLGGGGWSQLGDLYAITGDSDVVPTFGDGSTSSATWAVEIQDELSKVIGAVGLLAVDSGQKVEISNSHVQFPISRIGGRAISSQATPAGNVITQQHGGAWRHLSLEIEHVLADGTTEESYLYQSYWKETVNSVDTGCQGWPGPCWMSDDNDLGYMWFLDGEVEWPITTAGPRSTISIPMRIAPHGGKT